MSTSSKQRIKDSAQRADQMIEELAAKRSGEEPSEADPATGPESRHAEADDMVAIEQENDQGLDDGDNTASAPADSEAPEQGSAAQAREEARLWEQRYRSLDGMVKARDREVERLHDLIANMQRAMDSKADKGEQHASPAPAANSKDVELFGEDIVEFVNRVAGNAAHAVRSEVQQTIADLEDRLQGVTKTTEETASSSFETRLDSLAKNWRKLNTDTGFVEWLQAKSIRARMWREAVESRNAEEVAEFFTEYEELSGRAKAEADQPVQAKRERLERQVSPGKSRHQGKPPAREEQKTWTQSEIVRAYQQRHSMKKEDFDRLEREIAAAQREGRVDFSR